MGDQHHASVIN